MAASKTRTKIRAFTPALALLLGGAALAGSPKVDVDVVAVPASVTYSLPTATPPLASRAAYQVKIKNESRHVLNHVRFVAATTVEGAVATAAFVEASGLACETTNAEQTSINCPVGQLGSGASASFVLVFDAPAAGTGIKLGWTAYYGEGQRDRQHASHGDTQYGQVVTALTAPDPSAVRSYVPSSGATLYTGSTGVPTKSDPWTTSVTVPKAAVAEVVEDADPNSCSPDYTVCVRSTLTIPGSFDHLTITLRRDASTLRSCANIANAVLRYEPGAYNAAGVFVPSGSPVDIVKCDLLPGRMPNASYPRCVDSRIAFTKKNAPNPQLVGDWQFVLKALENGRISW